MSSCTFVAFSELLYFSPAQHSCVLGEPRGAATRTADRLATAIAIARSSGTVKNHRPAAPQNFQARRSSLEKPQEEPPKARCPSLLGFGAAEYQQGGCTRSCRSLCLQSSEFLLVRRSRSAPDCKVRPDRASASTALRDSAWTGHPGPPPPPPPQRGVCKSHRGTSPGRVPPSLAATLQIFKAMLPDACRATQFSVPRRWPVSHLPRRAANFSNFGTHRKVQVPFSWIPLQHLTFHPLEPKQTPTSTTPVRQAKMPDTQQVPTTGAPTGAIVMFPAH